MMVLKVYAYYRANNLLWYFVEHDVNFSWRAAWSAKNDTLTETSNQQCLQITNVGGETFPDSMV